MVVHEHSVPHRECLHAVADGRDLPDRLVPDPTRGPVVPPELLEVRAADPARGEGDRDLPGAGPGLGPFFEAEGRVR